jgi:hypothetical protein
MALRANWRGLLRRQTFLLRQRSGIRSSVRNQRLARHTAGRFVNTLATPIPSRTSGAHDLRSNVGRVDFKAGMPKVSWEPLLTKFEPHSP